VKTKKPLPIRKKKPKTKAKPSQKIQFYALVVPGSDSIFHAAENALMDRVVARLQGVGK
jgi:hypothetical protein